MGIIMKEFGLNVGLLCGVFLFAPLASAASIDFAEYPFNTNITNQYSDQGVIFSGYGHSVFIGAAHTSGGGNIAGLTHSITNPFPGTLHGIIATFIDPISSIDVGIHANRIGSSVNMFIYDVGGSLIDQVNFFQRSFLKGHASMSFGEDVGSIRWLASEPDDVPVAISNLSFETVQPIPAPEPLILMVIGLIGLARSVRRK